MTGFQTVRPGKPGKEMPGGNRKHNNTPDDPIPGAILTGAAYHRYLRSVARERSGSANRDVPCRR